MPRDTPTITAATCRKYAGQYYLDAAKRAFTGNLYLAGTDAQSAEFWRKQADDIETAAEEAARIEAECAAFDAAMAECA